MTVLPDPLCLNPPDLFDVLWPLQSTSPNISFGFSLQICQCNRTDVWTVTESPSSLCLGEEGRNSERLGQAIEQHPLLFQRGS